MYCVLHWLSSKMFLSQKVLFVLIWVFLKHSDTMGMFDCWCTMSLSITVIYWINIFSSSWCRVAFLSCTGVLFGSCAISSKLNFLSYIYFILTYCCKKPLPLTMKTLLWFSLSELLSFYPGMQSNSMYMGGLQLERKCISVVPTAFLMSLGFKPWREKKERTYTARGVSLEKSFPS